MGEYFATDVENSPTVPYLLILCGLLKIASLLLLPFLFYIASTCAVSNALHTLPSSSQHYLGEVESIQHALVFLNDPELRVWVAVRKSVPMGGGST